jgi:hypothetical protein
VRLKRAEVKSLRLRLLAEQDYICPLCGEEIFEGEDTLDHDHKTGHVRRVLHRACNTAEGKVLSWCHRSNATFPEDFLFNLLQYWGEAYDHHPIHPNHLTDEQKQIRIYRKKLHKAKRERTKQKYRDLISELQRRHNERSKTNR